MRIQGAVLGYRWSIPRSGKWLLAAVALVLVPAYTLSISLMYLMAAMLSSIFVYNMLITRVMLGLLDVTLLDVPRLYATREAVLRLQLTNTSRLFHTVYLRVDLQLAGLSSERVRVNLVARNGQAVVEVPIHALHRGLAEINTCTISTAYPFGLFARRKVFRLAHTALVYPALLAQAPAMLSAKQQEPGVLPRNTDDFQYLAGYQPGDDVRRIHWRKSTLLEQPVLKKDLARFQTFLPRLFLPDDCPHFEYAVSALATFSAGGEMSQGWAVVTDEGVREASNADDLMRILALVQPVSPEHIDRPYAEEGFRVIFASDIRPEVS